VHRGILLEKLRDLGMALKFLKIFNILMYFLLECARLGEYKDVNLEISLKGEQIDKFLYIQSQNLPFTYYFRTYHDKSKNVSWGIPLKE